MRQLAGTTALVAGGGNNGKAIALSNIENVRANPEWRHRTEGTT